MTKQVFRIFNDNSVESLDLKSKNLVDLKKLSCSKDDLRVERVTDILYCNEQKKWYPKVTEYGKSRGFILPPAMFDSYEEAVEYEVENINQCLMEALPAK